MYLACIVLILATYLSGCVPVLYTGVGQNVPLFEKKGEVALSAGYSEAMGEDYDVVFSSEYVEGFHAQAAAAVGNHTAIISSLYSLKGDGDWSGKGSYFELGIGRFTHNETKNLAGEIFMGVGFGSLNNSYDGSQVNVKYVKPFIQPSGGYTSRYFDLAFTPRIGLVCYTSKSVNLFDAGQINSFDDFWAEKRNTLVFEPGVTARVGVKNVKFQVQYSHTSFNASYGDEGYSPVYKNYLSLGLFILISDRWKTILND